ncbi:FkbM family methyltransferase [Candidatus Dojkabacteria bacterium]|jgi:FkbM family methyltransferase|nr:FkbM family methyltransferase [Candidatus Dojkabacteria bacterium]
MLRTKLRNYIINYTNSQEYHVLKNEIFINASYYFNIKNKNPKIIDCGSHIGLSLIYFKELYPNSSIVAIEPNPEVINILKQNIFENDLKDVEVIPKALSTDSNPKEFFFDSSHENWYSTGGFKQGSWQGIQKSKKTIVECVTLSSLINAKIDILKIDVEGFEEKILYEAKKKLNMIDNIVIEYHPISGNSFEKIIELLKASKFKINLFLDGKEVKEYRQKGLVIIKGGR